MPETHYYAADLLETSLLVETVADVLADYLPGVLSANLSPAITAPREFLTYQPGRIGTAPQLWVDTPFASRWTGDGASLAAEYESRSILVCITGGGKSPAVAAKNLRLTAEAVRALLTGWEKGAGPAYTALRAVGVRLEWQRTDFSENFEGGGGLFQIATLHFTTLHDVARVLWTPADAGPFVVSGIVTQGTNPVEPVPYADVWILGHMAIGINSDDYGAFSMSVDLEDGGYNVCAAVPADGLVGISDAVACVRGGVYTGCNITLG